MTDEIRLGPCCVCERPDGAVNIVMLNRRGPTPGRGWGCVLCRLPQDGAVAVMCDACVGLDPHFVCKGWAADPDRMLVTDLPEGKFEHNAIIHAADEARQ